MKKYIFYLAFFLISTLSFGQETEDEKIESLKTAFITEALSLTPEEAQAFWPIYNLFEDKKSRILDRKEIGITILTIDKYTDFILE